MKKKILRIGASLFLFSNFFMLTACHSCSFGEWSVEKAATCTEEGKEIRTCECGEKEERTIYATGHSFGDWSVVNASTCKEEGLEVRTCHCGAKEERDIELLDHNFGDWVVATEPTCTDQGLELRYCECGATETRPVAASHKATLTLSEDGTYYIVTGKGCGHDYIPSEYNGIPVKEIGNNAFLWTNLTEITIPEGITKIGEYAFCGSSIVNLTLPSTLESIGAYAFSSASKLESITVPASLTSVGENAFSNCSKLTKVEISDLDAWVNIDFANVNANPLTYAKALYLDGEKITSLVIPEETTTIKKYAFSNNTGIQSVKLPSSITSIGEDAFVGCTNLKKVEINDIVSWCSVKFANVNSNPTSLAMHLYMNESEVTELAIPEGVENINSYAFSNLQYISEIIIPDSLITIGEDAFIDCNRISKTHIPSIEAWCGIDFANLASNPLYTASYNELYVDDVRITNLVIPEGIATIKNYTFYGCGYFTEISIPSSVTSIGDYAFYYCGIESLQIPKNVLNIGDYAFGGCSNLSNLEINEGLLTIGQHAFENCTKLKFLTVPKTVTAIGSGAFSGDHALMHVSLPFVGERLDGTGNVLFEAVFDTGLHHGYSSLKTVVITGGTTVGKEAFDGWYYIERIDLSYSSITSIGERAFAWCSNLKNVYIPKGVTSIGANIFSGSKNLSSVTLPFVNSYTHFGYYFGASSYYDNSTYVPSTLKNVTINGGTKIPNNAFYNCSNITSIDLPNTLEEIGNNAFYSCQKITYIKIPSSVISIGKQAFYSCHNLSTVSFANTNGWTYSSSYKDANGNSIFVTNTSTNATNLRGSYRDYYWYKKY